MTRDEYLQGLRHEYLRITGKSCIELAELYEWAEKTGKYQWEPPPDLKRKKGMQEFAHALRQETYIDQQGREVRLNRCNVKSVGQTKFSWWDSMLSASPDFLEKSFQQERMGILARCRKLKVSFDSYKQNINPGTQMELVWDFTDDLVEGELATKIA